MSAILKYVILVIFAALGLNACSNASSKGASGADPAVSAQAAALKLQREYYSACRLDGARTIKADDKAPGFDFTPVERASLFLNTDELPFHHGVLSPDSGGYIGEYPVKLTLRTGNSFQASLVELSPKTNPPQDGPEPLIYFDPKQCTDRYEVFVTALLEIGEEESQKPWTRAEYVGFLVLGADKKVSFRPLEFREKRTGTLAPNFDADIAGEPRLVFDLSVRPWNGVEEAFFTSIRWEASSDAGDAAADDSATVSFVQERIGQVNLTEAQVN